MAEVKFLVTNSAGITKEYKALTSHNINDCSIELGMDKSKLEQAYNLGSFNYCTNRDCSSEGFDDKGFYYYYQDLFNIMLTKAGAARPMVDDKVMMTLKPLYYPADIMFFSRVCDGPTDGCTSNRDRIVAGPYSYLNSTGYYGGVTRTLTANIDRQSGTLYDLYDYVIFKGN